MEKKLTTLEIGQTATIVQLLATGGMRRRLQDLGMIESTLVECLHKSPCGDPIAYLVKGASIALRTEDSDTIIISI